ncbi:MAG: prepilin-type N-terminal cleavage/methylation domain-containing protein [Patescibacteria group bacterium]|nr:prepilin-type N-terminal cleavage/methylation domain-containing protein [Patescibacteria group bacterium]
MKKYLPQTINNPEGFTLIELLVVIAIIAILSVVGIALFTSTQQKARDSKRIQDIIAMSKAMEVNYQNNVYPTTVSSTWFSDQTVPVDPRGASAYASSGPSGTGSLSTAGYTLCATLETSIGNATSTTGANLGTTGGANGFYCRRNAQ